MFVPTVPPRINPVKTADKNILAAANSYQLAHGLPPQPTLSPYLPVDEGLSAAVADAYEELPHRPHDPVVRSVYHAFKHEVRRQFIHLVLWGYRLEPWLKEGQPYADSQEMMADVRHGHLFFFLGGHLPADHLLLQPTGLHFAGRPLNHNDLFRAVHDVFGHALFGNGFGPRGEEHAWKTHLAMFTPKARRALTAETRGQNSWFNFGRHVRGRNVPPQDRPFAEQKNVLLPDQFNGLSSSESTSSPYSSSRRHPT